MVRDPVCGTYVVPGKALELARGRETLYFCSEKCRDEYSESGVPMRTEEQIRADIVEIGRRLWERGYVASNDGNISVRLDDRRLITTPKNVSKGFMTPDMMVVTDFDGHEDSPVIANPRPS